ncbi:K7_Aqr1ap, partial [Saccharomyces cerevisiae Kyokai no. 7]
MSRSNSIYTEDIEMYPTHNEQHLTREYTKPDGQTKSEKLNFEGAYINSHGTLSKTTTREIEGDLDSETSSHSSDDKVDPTQQITAETKAPYTLLSYGQKWGMVAILTMCGFWSSLGSPIYYPALRQLEKQFNVDENMVNVTVVVYLLFQGISPTVSGGLA